MRDHGPQLQSEGASLRQPGMKRPGRRGLAQPEVQAKFASLGMELALQTPAQFDAFVAKEYDKWAKVIKQAGIEAN